MGIKSRIFIKIQIINNNIRWDMYSNSHICLWVIEFSALKTGSISKNIWKSPIKHICLYNWGDWARQAFSTELSQTKDIGSSLWASGSELGCVNFDEIVIDQEFCEKLTNTGWHSENSLLSSSTEINNSVIKTGFDLDDCFLFFLIFSLFFLLFFLLLFLLLLLLLFFLFFFLFLVFIFNYGLNFILSCSLFWFSFCFYLLFMFLVFLVLFMLFMLFSFSSSSLFSSLMSLILLLDCFRLFLFFIIELIIGTFSAGIQICKGNLPTARLTTNN